MSKTSTGIPDDIRESAAIGNIKSVAEQPAMLSNLTFSNLINNDNLSQQNALSNQQAMNQLGLTTSGKAINRITNSVPRDTTAIQKLNTANELAQQIADFRAEQLKPSE